MELAVKAAAVGLTGTVLALLLRRNTPELSLALSLCAGLLAGSLCIGICGEIADSLRRLAVRSGVSYTLITPVFKCVGIGIVTELASQLCADSGQKAVGSFLELCGTLCALFAALPLLRALTAVVEKLI